MWTIASGVSLEGCKRGDVLNSGASPSQVYLLEFSSYKLICIYMFLEKVFFEVTNFKYITVMLGIASPV